jgi:hypothetical protein
MYVQDLNESLVMEDSEGKVDFDSAAMSDPVGAGWGMDDLDAMLLQGMQKKKRQRIALYGVIAVVGLGLGVVVTLATASALAKPEPAAPPPVPKDCVDFSNPAGDNVTITCPKYTGPDGQEVDCTLCNPNKHSDKPCPSGCNCLAYCNPDKGVVARPASAAPLTSVL